MAAKKPTRSLATYDAKRDFTKSPEPRGPAKAKAGAAALSFCVQKHLASHLHYDLRLEHCGVLLSWAVPKGPSLNPADKRMAVHVEDHPVAYGDFEGVIPSGYGAGVVLLWDRGTWTPEAATPDVDAALAAGELKFRLDGVKLRGSWVLIRTHRQPAGRPEQWLLIKHRDAWSGDVDVTELGDSVKTFGDLPAVLATHGTPAEWKTHPPVKGGEAGRLLAEVMAAAGAGKATPAAVVKIAAQKSAQRHDPSSPSPKPQGPSPASPRPKFTNRDKVLFAADRFTKGDLIDYYTRIAPLILPQLAGRAVTFNRFPDGVAGKSFFEKRCNVHRPSWVQTVRVPAEKAGGKTIDFCAIDGLPALQWAANMAAIELHVPLALAAEPNRPTAMIFDFDPGPPAGFADCVAIALRLKALLDTLGLASLPKTSGGKGLHVLVPLNTPGISFADTKAFARAVALTLQQDDPKRVIAAMTKSDRIGRVFVDWSQNDRNKTNACVFSVRARERPTVSWPLEWAALSDRKLPPPVLASAEMDQSAETRLLKLLDRKQTLPVQLTRGD